MRLGLVIRRYRLMEEIGVRDLARKIGISPATLSRLERGKACDGSTLAKILNWLLQ